ncbi:hydratase/decarboxylase family protein (plasmid) [Ketogulonicigenium robustum]|uniref:Hydratase/decarboxylase family protein n=1 Tax=Ketogulonicigenium robustum TaxID=92947 RepID=A0A1W6P308_9RHOB|nr:hypothetical protein [Ketogulonicigenium robustum]ARO15898.1 hydratase/decarboxylase family protein [Ketogulonicigenium robustum]
MTATFDPQIAAAQLVATRNGQPRATGLQPPPTDVVAAYAVQGHVMRTLGGPACWKMAMMGGVDRQAGAMPVTILYPNGGHVAGLPHDAAIEVETAFVLAQDLPADCTLDEVVAAVGAVHLAFEIVASRFADRSAITPLTALADSFSSAAIVLGDAIADWESALQRPLGLSLTRGADAPDTVEIVPTLAEQIDFIHWLAGHAVAHGLPLVAGTVIISGARIGPIAMAGIETASALGGGASVSAKFSYSA